MSQSGCRAAPLPPPEPARHLILVTIDTLRADRLGAYGYSGASTPHMDRIASEGMLAPQAMAHVPLTRPSHANLFTGRLPFQIGIRDNTAPALPASVPLLAETLNRAGFATAAFVSSLALDGSSGLDRGFDVYEAHFEGGQGAPDFLSAAQRRGDDTTRDALRWLARHTTAAEVSARLFLWLHLYDPHDPYDAPEPYATRFADRPYDGEVAWADELVGRLDAALERTGLAQESLFVVTSDHGEGLGEHGETLHGFFVYETTLRVPFLARGPTIPAASRLAVTLRLVDFFPTVLDLLGIPEPPSAGFAGVSLAEALRGRAPPDEPVSYAESLVPSLHFGWSDLRAVRRGRWKYILAPRPELYDLEADPGETNNLAPTHATQVATLHPTLAGFLKDERRAAVAIDRQGSASPGRLETLAALGYVGGGAPARTTTPEADPKDRVEDFRFASDHTREGLLRFQDGDYAASIQHFRAVLSRDIESAELHFYLARSLFAAGGPGVAAEHYEEAVRRAPVHQPAWRGLAASRAATGDADGALEALRRGIDVLPEDAALRLGEARLLGDLGRGDAARKSFEAAIALDPTDGAARAQLANLLRELGLIDEALRRFREAVGLEPSNAYYWTSLGMTLGGAGRLDEAERAFREAWRLDGQIHYHAYNLGLILLRRGHPVQARSFFERTLALKSDFAPAREQLAALAGPGRQP